MLNDKILNDLMEIMGESNDLMCLKGQLRNIEQREKDNKEIYYLADLKVAKKVNDSVYGTAFDIYHICFPSEFVKVANIDIEKMRTFKDNEVFVHLTPTSRINISKGDRKDKYNSSNYYVNDVILVQQISKGETFKTKIVNL